MPLPAPCLTGNSDKSCISRQQQSSDMFNSDSYSSHKYGNLTRCNVYIYIKSRDDSVQPEIQIS